MLYAVSAQGRGELAIEPRLRKTARKSIIFELTPFNAANCGPLPWNRKYSSISSRSARCFGIRQLRRQVNSPGELRSEGSPIVIQVALPAPSQRWAAFSRGLEKRVASGGSLCYLCSRSSLRVHECSGGDCDSGSAVVRSARGSLH